MTCQAYEGERAYICATEKSARKKGYEAAKDGKPKTDNPYGWDIYRKQAWDIGHDIFTEGMKLW